MAANLLQTPSRAELRKLLEEVLPGPADLDAFCIDYFPDIYRRFESGMDRVSKLNLLLVIADCTEIFAYLVEMRTESILSLSATARTLPQVTRNERKLEDKVTTQNESCIALRSGEQHAGECIKDSPLCLIKAASFRAFYRLHSRNISRIWFQNRLAGSAIIILSMLMVTISLWSSYKREPVQTITYNCPNEMASLPSGTFTMGYSNGDSDEKPEHEVSVDGFCMDRTEVTVAAYTQCVQAKVCQPHDTALWGKYSAEEAMVYSQFCNFGKADRLDHPINCVDYWQANEYCLWLRKRLPTEIEWEYAARGDDGRTYPWGNGNPDAEWLNACGGECAAMATSRGWSWPKMYQQFDRWPTTAIVGTTLGDKSPFGIFDLAGNVAEWVDSYYTECYGTGCPANKQLLVARGACWASNQAKVARTTFRRGLIPTVRDAAFGFRCAKSK